MPAGGWWTSTVWGRRASECPAGCGEAGGAASMLSAQKEQLLADYRVRIIKLREKELDLLLTQSLSIATTFALLGGVMADAMWTGYFMYTIQPGERDGICPCSWLEAFAAGSMYTSIFLPLLGLWHSMLLTLLAPRKALHGAPELLGETVDAFKAEVLHSLKLLGASVVSVFSTGASWAWATNTFVPISAVASVLVTLVCAASLSLAHGAWLVTRSSFRIDEGSEVTSSFFAHAAVDRGDGGGGDGGGYDATASGGDGYTRVCGRDEDATSARRGRLREPSATSRSEALRSLASSALVAGRGALIGLSAEEETELRSFVSSCRSSGTGSQAALLL